MNGEGYKIRYKDVGGKSRAQDTGYRKQVTKIWRRIQNIKRRITSIYTSMSEYRCVCMAD